jgi:hypothetical protein
MRADGDPSYDQIEDIVWTCQSELAVEVEPDRKFQFAPDAAPWRLMPLTIMWVLGSPRLRQRSIPLQRPRSMRIRIHQRGR